MDAVGDTFKEYMQNPEFALEWEKYQQEQLGKTIAAMRQAQNLTQADLAERTGIIQGDISKIENGKANPTLDTLKRIAKGLGMHLDIRFVENLHDSPDRTPV